MWVYRSNDDTRDGLTPWEVGYFMPDRTWFCESAFSNREAAAARVNYLNGGPAEQYTKVPRAPQVPPSKV